MEPEDKLTFGELEAWAELNPGYGNNIWTMKEFLVDLALNGDRDAFLYVCKLFAQYPHLAEA